MNTQLLAQWQQAKANLDFAKKIELDLRNKIIGELPGDIGTTTNEVDGFKVKITRSVNRSIDDDELANIWDSLSELEKACIKYKPALDATLYGKLPANSTLSRAITVKPAQPALKVEIDGTED